MRQQIARKVALQAALHTHNGFVGVAQGFSAESPAADYLRFKTFLVEHRLSDDEVCAPDFLDNLLPVCRTLKPFNDFMNAAVLEY